MADLTAIILTKNEEANLEKCISSIQFVAKRIAVAEVVQHPLEVAA